MKIYKDENGMIIIDGEGATLKGDGTGVAMHTEGIKPGEVMVTNFIVEGFEIGMEIDILNS
jgi:hypothetical protein